MVVLCALLLEKETLAKIKKRVKKKNQNDNCNNI